MKVKSFLMLSAVVFLWGSSFTLIKLGLKEIQPLTLASLRFLLALPLLVVSMRFQSKNIFKMFKFPGWKYFPILGLTGVTLYHALQNLGLNFTTASNSSVIIASNPVFIALFSHFYLKERLNVKKALGIALAFSGVLAVILHRGTLSLALNPMGVMGDFLCLGAALCWAFYSVFGKKALTSFNAHVVTTYSMLFGTLSLLPLIFFFEKPSLPTSLWLWFLLSILGFLCSGLAYLFWYKALEEEQASKAGVFLFFVPVISVSIANIILLEPLSLLFVAGAFLIMLGVWITERG